jgi:hypothetical protein
VSGLGQETLELQEVPQVAVVFACQALEALEQFQAAFAPKS